jgi:hypothetical protein
MQQPWVVCEAADDASDGVVSHNASMAVCKPSSVTKPTAACTHQGDWGAPGAVGVRVAHPMVSHTFSAEIQILCYVTHHILPSFSQTPGSR